MTFRDNEDFDDYDKRATAKLNELTARSNTLPEGEVKGAVIGFPRADGRALYLVVNDKPLKLMHLPYGDAWHIDAPTLRGLRLADVQQRVRGNRALRSIFGRH
jgi:hypothetical protein